MESGRHIVCRCTHVLECDTTEVMAGAVGSCRSWTDITHGSHHILSCCPCRSLPRKPLLPSYYTVFQRIFFAPKYRDPNPYRAGQISKTPTTSGSFGRAKTVPVQLSETSIRQTRYGCAGTYSSGMRYLSYLGHNERRLEYAEVALLIAAPI